MIRVTSVLRVQSDQEVLLDSGVKREMLVPWASLEKMDPLVLVVTPDYPALKVKHFDVIQYVRN